MYSPLLIVVMALCVNSLVIIPSTPHPETTPTLSTVPHRFYHKLHRIHENANDHHNGPISKADLVMAVIDKFGTTVDNFAENMTEELDGIFKKHFGTPPLGSPLLPEDTPPPLVNDGVSIENPKDP